ncbi:lasso peptide biosynthesis PqqD family chaperone [Nocardia blacklockiae]|uniref:lasso peptide biosynthesis PqqD family chaperone n=1 Tax=Nocardia blacklockiae TaxID=480036 RepID=UPI0018933944|nr:lasso peptide biosynthesis PqqD family chaperone [Nocardia blacklockiae]MBF6175025.1 lasso peptide biosynthesis PqqD family chaperone [Nocardia blacklockiae]
MNRLRDDVSLCATPDGTILLDERNGRYWQLNPTGTEILAALLDGVAEDEVVRRLTESRPVARERAAADVADLLTQLARADLVESS